MGRMKLAIKMIETPSGRHTTFSKRKSGLMKKTYELSTLCDTDVAVIMFSPSRNCYFFPPDRIESIIDRFLTIPEDEKSKKRLESQEMLSKIIKSYSTGGSILLGSPEVRCSNPSTSIPEPMDFYNELLHLRRLNRLLEQQLSIFHGNFELITQFDHMQNVCEILLRSYKSACEYMTQRFQHEVRHEPYADMMQPHGTPILHIDNLLENYESSFKLDGRNFLEDDKMRLPPFQNSFNTVLASSQMRACGSPCNEASVQVRYANMETIIPRFKDENSMKDCNEANVQIRYANMETIVPRFEDENSMKDCNEASVQVRYANMETIVPRFKDENSMKDFIPSEHVHSQPWHYLESLEGATTSQPPYYPTRNEQVEQNLTLNSQSYVQYNINGQLDLGMLQPQQEGQGSCSDDDSLKL